MSGGKPVRPPWWQKPAHKIFEMSADDARPLLRRFPEKVPTGVGFMKRAGLVADGRPEEFEALAGRIAVFRLDGIQQR